MSDTSVSTAPSAQGVASPPVVLPPAAPSPSPRPVPPALRALKALASLKLTVVLFVLSLLLVFFGTLAQIDSGIWTVVDRYFWSLIVLVPFKLFFQFGEVFLGLPEGINTKIPGYFPFPGGKLLGGLLLINLLAAHAVRFKVSLKRIGILLTHAGLVLLFVGEGITREFAVEGNMTIPEGEAVNYVEEHRKVELAVIDPKAKDAEGNPVDDVVVVPDGMLRPAAGRWLPFGKKAGPQKISDDRLPFDIEVVQFMANSRLDDVKADNLADTGAGLENQAVEQGEISGTSTKQSVEIPSLYVKLTTRDGKDLGTYLFSLHLREQKVTVGEKEYDVALRFKRSYKPFSLRLIKFSFDRYPGTEKPRNYSSLVRLVDPERGEDRNVLIRMNDPLRHRGETFYQASFDAETEKTTVLQVVRNPGWVLPYFSCVIVALGLVIHFGISLVNFLQRRVAA